MKCRKCGNVSPLEEKQAVCASCRTILRRCVDCSHYDIRTSFCGRTNRQVDVGEAHYPTYSSPSTYCREYGQTAAAAA